MRPVIHSICSLYAQSLRGSPTQEQRGAFDSIVSGIERRLLCDITEEYLGSRRTPASAPITRVLAWTHGASEEVERVVESGLVIAARARARGSRRRCSTLS